MNGIILSTALMTLITFAVGCGRHDPIPSRVEAEWPQFRHQVDKARNRVWFLTRDGVRLYDLDAPEKIRHIQLPDWVWIGEPLGCMPDLTLGPIGEALVSSNVVPWLWRIDPDTLAVSKHELALDTDAGKEIGFSGLAYSAEQRAFIAVSPFHGSLWRIDASLATAQKIQLSAPIPQACGIAIRPRAFEGKMARAVRLCVDTGQGGWAVDLAPDQRSGHVTARSCQE
ncbi:MAG: hypothetical protein ACKVQU_35085 [Burkholderiales bacterium]